MFQTQAGGTSRWGMLFGMGKLGQGSVSTLYDYQSRLFSKGEQG